ncbi:MAG TPA: thioesterase family protein [Chthoniobacterales bacterium]
MEFAHTDMGGVMFFGRYLELAHRAYEDLVCHGFGIEWQNWFDNPNWIAPIRALNVEYLSPLRGGSECQIQVRVKKSGGSSFTHTYTFVSDGKDVAVVSLTSVFVDKKSFRKIPIPGPVRKALEEYPLAETAAT